MQPAMAELQDAIARVKAQVHVLKLAILASTDETDIRAVIASLDGVEEELLAAERILGR